MLGDYGWGLYINDGELGYSSQYSISQHPNSNTTIQEDVWTEVTVTIEEDVGGEFFIDGNPAGNFSEDARIPRGTSVPMIVTNQVSTTSYINKWVGLL